jgi:flagellar FliL protein
MATAAAPVAEATPEAAPAKGKKKLIIIIAAVSVLVLALGGGAAFFLMKKKSADAATAESAEGDGAEAHAPAKAAKHDSKNVPVFVPLEPFTVNLADRDAERYAQVGITLEVEDSHVGDQIKVYMPAIRNHILMAISDRTAGDLMGREGKARLAEKVRREASRALGADIGPEPDEEADAQTAAKPKPKTRKKAVAELPVKAVHFSNFIIQ